MEHPSNKYQKYLDEFTVRELFGEISDDDDDDSSMKIGETVCEMDANKNNLTNVSLKKNIDKNENKVLKMKKIDEFKRKNGSLNKNDSEKKELTKKDKKNISITKDARKNLPMKNNDDPEKKNNDPVKNNDDPEKENIPEKRKKKINKKENEVSKKKYTDLPEKKRKDHSTKHSEEKKIKSKGDEVFAFSFVPVNHKTDERKIDSNPENDGPKKKNDVKENYVPKDDLSRKRRMESADNGKQEDLNKYIPDFYKKQVLSWEAVDKINDESNRLLDMLCQPLKEKETNIQVPAKKKPKIVNVEVMKKGVSSVKPDSSKTHQIPCLNVERPSVIVWAGSQKRHQMLSDTVPDSKPVLSFDKFIEFASMPPPPPPPLEFYKNKQTINKM